MNKEKAILFSTPMVKALLNTKPDVWPPEPIDGEKTFKWQTRRVIKRMPFCDTVIFDGIVHKEHKKEMKEFAQFSFPKSIFSGKCDFAVPFATGDILYVLETWLPSRWTPGYKYKADFDDEATWRPPRHMPRAAARLFLKVQNVRAEKLQNMAEKESWAEGVLPINPFTLPQIPTSIIAPGGAYGKGYILNKSYKAAFYQLWETIHKNKEYSWDSNPWVWVIEFARISKPEEVKA